MTDLIDYDVDKYFIFILPHRVHMANDNIKPREEMYQQTYAEANFHIKLTSALNHLKVKKHLCDIVIVCQNERFHAHKLVLAASSEYFFAMFAGGLSESRPTINEVSFISGMYFNSFFRILTPFCNFFIFCLILQKVLYFPR